MAGVGAASAAEGVVGSCLCAHARKVGVVWERDPVPQRYAVELGAMSKNCGSLYCQRDSYARSLNSVIVSCQPIALDDANHKYELVLEDTILFPEGGGR